jgi:hypothetical protein
LITDDGGSGGAGGEATLTELAGGMTTGGGACGGPAVTADDKDCRDCWRLVGFVTSCCMIPTHGTPPCVVSAIAGAAKGLSRGTDRYAPAVPRAMMTSRFVVRDIVFPTSLRLSL